VEPTPFIIIMLAHVTNAIMTSYTGQRAQLFWKRIQRMNYIAVAFTARVFRNLTVKITYLYWLMKVARGKCQRMVVSIDCLNQVFVKESFGRVAIIAGRNIFMAGLYPTVVMIIHDMAVSAGHGIIKHVRSTVRVNESE
jgi:hypothetical protein